MGVIHIRVSCDVTWVGLLRRAVVRRVACGTGVLGVVAGIGASCVVGRHVGGRVGLVGPYGVDT